MVRLCSPLLGFGSLIVATCERKEGGGGTSSTCWRFDGILGRDDLRGAIFFYNANMTMIVGRMYTWSIIKCVDW